MTAAHSPPSDTGEPASEPTATDSPPPTGAEPAVPDPGPSPPRPARTLRRKLPLPAAILMAAAMKAQPAPDPAPAPEPEPVPLDPEQRSDLIASVGEFMLLEHRVAQARDDERIRILCDGAAPHVLSKHSSGE